MSRINLTKEGAQERADVMAKRLADTVGGRWSTRVWFNLWWCYSVQCATICVSEYDGANGSRYSALISDDPKHAGYGAGIWTLDTGPMFSNQVFDTPEDAVKAAMCKHLDVVDRLFDVAEMNRSQLRRIDWDKRHEPKA